MKNFTFKTFVALAETGTLRKGTGNDLPIEDDCETGFELGLVNGYSLADICHFYAWRVAYDASEDDWHKRALLKRAYGCLKHDAATFGVSLIRHEIDAHQRRVQSDA